MARSDIFLPGVRVERQVGSRIYCYCPFHKEGQERRPALTVYLDGDRGPSWKCHACNEHGMLTDLLIRAGHLTAGAAADTARRMQVDAKPKATVRHRDLPTCPEYLLGAMSGSRPTNLIHLGFSREVLDELEVGWDEPRTRVAYPVRDEVGRLLGVVGGAAFPENDPSYAAYYGTEPKYLAYGKNQGFPFQLNPKWTLWNYHHARASTVNEGLLIVEGFKALLWMRMAGWINVVATFGTSYEQDQVMLLSKLMGPYLIFLDNDEAGRRAAWHLKKDLQKRRSGVIIVGYPRAVKQPDGLALKEAFECCKAAQYESRC